jgi:glutamate/aspartate transport system permease protein
LARINPRSLYGQERQGKSCRGCFGKGDITYLDWMLSAWGWTVSVSLLALVLALVVGSLIGTLRTLPDTRGRAPGQCLGGAVPQHPAAGADFLWYHVVPALFPR